MTENDFVGRLLRVAVFTVALAALAPVRLRAALVRVLRLATVALAAGVAVTWLLWKRLPAAGRSRWWALLLGLPVCLAALVQIGFWFLFFSQGPTNPMFGSYVRCCGVDRGWAAIRPGGCSGGRALAHADGGAAGGTWLNGPIALPMPQAAFILFTLLDIFSTSHHDAGLGEGVVLPM